MVMSFIIMILVGNDKDGTKGSVLIAELGTVMGHKSGVARAGGAGRGSQDNAAAKLATGRPEPVLDHPSKSFDGGLEGKQGMQESLCVVASCAATVVLGNVWSTLVAIIGWLGSPSMMMMMTMLVLCGTRGAVQGFKYNRAGLDVKYCVAPAT
jgi:hypothetical protein